MRTTVTKKFQFDCAHMLVGHQGDCKNLHGHTYLLEVTVSLEAVDMEQTVLEDRDGMVIDFKQLGATVRRNIIDVFDHAFIWNSNAYGVEQQIAALLMGADMKVARVPYRPTAENMVRDFFQILEKAFALTRNYIVVECIRLYETPSSFAEYRRD